MWREAGEGNGVSWREMGMALRESSWGFSSQGGICECGNGTEKASFLWD